MRPAAACPHCGRPASAGPGNGPTCGGFDCLYRHFAGGPPPVGALPRHPLPWADPREVARIAVLRPGQLGDLLLALPGLRALRREFPQAEITLIAQPWAAGLFRRFRWIDRILPLQEVADGMGGWDGGDTLRVLPQKASARQYDLVLQLQADAADYARLALALGGRATAGFCRDEEVGRSFHRLLRMSPGEPEILRVLRLVHDLGVRPEGVHLEFPLLPEDLEELEAIPELRDQSWRRPVVALHAGARAPARRWPVDH
ncbi:MAG: glycosyltransferase family 9 protein, partial [Chloroflexota bacterium]